MLYIIWFVVSLFFSQQQISFKFKHKYNNFSIWYANVIGGYFSFLWLWVIRWKDFDSWNGRCLLCFHKVIIGWLHFYVLSAYKFVYHCIKIWHIATWNNYIHQANIYTDIYPTPTKKRPKHLCLSKIKLNWGITYPVAVDARTCFQNISQGLAETGHSVCLNEWSSESSEILTAEVVLLFSLTISLVFAEL